jgi:ABC-2 type transport system permease protein
MSESIPLPESQPVAAVSVAPSRGDGAAGTWLFWAVFKRELRQYLQTPGTYVAMAFFLILSGSLFTLILGDYLTASAQVTSGGKSLGDGDLPLDPTVRIITQLFSTLNFLMLFLIPILTMRLVSEEKRSGTFELLLSTPLGNWSILLGKYLAALTMGTILLALCGVYPLLCRTFCQPETPVVFSCFLGLFLIILAYTAFGLFASSLTESQIASAVLSFAGLLLFHMVGWLFKSGALGAVASGVSIYQHSDNFTRGVVASHDVLFFLLFTIFFLFLAAQSLDARRWRA